MVLALKPEGAQFGWLRQDPSRRLEAAGGSQVGEPQKGIILPVSWQENVVARWVSVRGLETLQKKLQTVASCDCLDPTCPTRIFSEGYICWLSPVSTE